MIAEAIVMRVAIEIAILPVSFADLMAEPNSVDLIHAYADECSVPDAEPQPAIYEAMEKAGVLKCFAAYAYPAFGQKDTPRLLVGFCSVITAIVPHDGHLVATTESLFVDPNYRLTSAFEDLFSTAEKYAIDADCRVLCCSARVGSALDKVLSRRTGFTQTHAQHTKWLGRWA